MRLGILRRIRHIRAGKKGLAIGLAVLLILLPLALLVLRSKAAPLALPVFESVAESRVRRLVGEVAEELVNARESGEFCTLTYAADGSVRSLWVNSDAVNSLLAELSKELEERLTGLGLTCKIKSGDLLFPKLFSGSGIPLTVRGSAYGGASARPVSALTEGGLNQTLHRLEIEVTVPLTLTVLGEESRITVTSRVLIGETVIVGAIPGGVVVGG